MDEAFEQIFTPDFAHITYYLLEQFCYEALIISIEQGDFREIKSLPIEYFANSFFKVKRHLTLCILFRFNPINYHKAKKDPRTLDIDVSEYRLDQKNLDINRCRKKIVSAIPEIEHLYSEYMDKCLPECIKELGYGAGYHCENINLDIIETLSPRNLREIEDVMDKNCLDILSVRISHDGKVYERRISTNLIDRCKIIFVSENSIEYIFRRDNPETFRIHGVSARIAILDFADLNKPISSYQIISPTDIEAKKILTNAN